jgi:hypothetical protein
VKSDRIKLKYFTHHSSSVLSELAQLVQPQINKLNRHDLQVQFIEEPIFVIHRKSEIPNIDLAYAKFMSFPDHKNYLYFLKNYFHWKSIATTSKNLNKFATIFFYT